MKLLAVSDTHKRPSVLFDLIANNPGIDGLIHLGDGVNDADEVSGMVGGELITVIGNNDSYGSAPEHRIIIMGGERIYLTHGHFQNVRKSREMLAKIAKENGCPYVLYGHTHVVSDETIDGVRLMNPGSLTYPFGERSAIMIDDSSGSPRFEFLRI